MLSNVHGYKIILLTLKEILKEYGLHKVKAWIDHVLLKDLFPRCLVADIMQEIDPVSFLMRENRKLSRRQYTCVGPNFFVVLFNLLT